MQSFNTLCDGVGEKEEVYMYHGNKEQNTIRINTSCFVISIVSGILRVRSSDDYWPSRHRYSTGPVIPEFQVLAYQPS
jgi:hypothetical protein